MGNETAKGISISVPPKMYEDIEKRKKSSNFSPTNFFQDRYYEFMTGRKRVSPVVFMGVILNIVFGVSLILDALLKMWLLGLVGGTGLWVGEFFIACLLVFVGVLIWIMENRESVK